MAMAARLVSASTTVRSALARKAGGAVALNSAGVTQSPWRTAEREIDPGGVLEVEPLGQAVGGQRRGWRQRARADRRLAGDDDLADRAGFLAVVQQDRSGGACRRRHVDEGIDPAARRQHQRAVAGLERLGRLAVDGHHTDLVAFSILIAITERWQPLIKRSLTRSLVRAEISNEVWPLIV
mgnify:CR=1 FL=1